jgi:peptidyl-prolyl cis-trans isomerase D
MRSLAKYIWVLVALFFVGGFLLYQTSGLMGRVNVTPTTAVATVNGHDILYSDYTNRVQAQMQSAQQQGQTLTEDDNRRIENSVFEQMVSEILLQDEYRRRGISVNADEIREFAQFAPPSWITSVPDLQTDGQFDRSKYQALLASPQARTSGLLVQLEDYYRSEIPREKLFDELASGVYVTDAELWRIWEDQHDSAQVSFVAWHPTPNATEANAISDGDLHDYYDAHKAEFNRPGRAVLTVVQIPRIITAADTAAARAKADSLRAQIIAGAKFEDVAKEQSADSASAVNGGDLGRESASRFVPEFTKAALALKPGEISQPVLTQFGFHIIRMDARGGADTVALHHILLRIVPSDSSSTIVDRKADELAKEAANSDQGSKLDSAAAKLGLAKEQVIAFEGTPATFKGEMVPSVSGWAFNGAKPGETSDLFDTDNGYVMARVDSITEGGTPPFDAVKEDIRTKVAQIQAIDKLMPVAKQVADAARTSSLEAAAQQKGFHVDQTPMFARGSFVPGLGQFTEAIGAAFGVKQGAITQPVRTDDGVYVERVDKRVTADSATWAAQKGTQRQTRLDQLRQQRVQMFLSDLRKAAKITDHRKEIAAATRQASTT